MKKKKCAVQKLLSFFHQKYFGILIQHQQNIICSFNLHQCFAIRLLSKNINLYDFMCVHSVLLGLTNPSLTNLLS